MWFIYAQRSEFRGSARSRMKDAPQMHSFAQKWWAVFKEKYKAKGAAKDEEVEMRRDGSLVSAGTLQTHSSMCLVEVINE